MDEEIVQRFLAGYHSDKDFASIIDRTQNKSLLEHKQCAYCLAANRLLYFEDADGGIRLCVPLTECMAVIKEVHDSTHESVHTGQEHTLASLRSRFYWPNLCCNVTNYVSSCNPCQRVKHDRGPQEGYLQPLTIPSKPFDTISLDFITGLPESH